MLTLSWEVRNTLVVTSVFHRTARYVKTYVWMTSAAKANIKLERPAGCSVNYNKVCETRLD